MTSRLLLLTCGVCSILAFAMNARAGDQAKADVTAFRAYLEKQQPAKRWQSGPTVLDSDEIRKAYGKRRFCFVFSSPPLPPGANLPELIEAYRQRSVEFQKNFTSLSVAFDEKDAIAPLTKPQDYNVGLMKVQTDEQARIAGAAILSLHGSDRVGPGVVAAKEVMVTKSAKGWNCTVQRQNAFIGTVVFDAGGTCTSIAKSYAGPVPP